ncbi:hypothetical protein [Halalkalibacter alkalisediminis]|uniref:HEAT repeat domain-containing protein n=1 Tax=Halalkalibacter alkalisediminis TaxID=935616 RepID=A0ABV6NNB2_9BACI|nr:hypothetical protein [Halalkalibacter alkalisediminis]
MNLSIKSYFENLQSKDKDLQYEAYEKIMSAIDEKVDWAYDVWEQLMKDLTNADPHRRSRAAQFLCGLAKSDPEKRILNDFTAIWEVTKDQKFVTARHSLQSTWKVGLAGTEQKEMVVDKLKDRFIHCEDEKNYTLIRFDLIQGLRYLYDHLKDEEIKHLALELINKEEDGKYKKKYSSVWKNA